LVKTIASKIHIHTETHLKNLPQNTKSVPTSASILEYASKILLHIKKTPPTFFSILKKAPCINGQTKLAFEQVQGTISPPRVQILLQRMDPHNEIHSCPFGSRERHKRLIMPQTKY
jgi:hypothetical protein